ncbi:LCP family protein [Streptomyces turgidiscabies]|uniref:LCP family protein required for cell wall assembly n=1 Tax=Streptomyces turgidiscabies TaxID=85558 RepID=A0ABU0RJ75_9ACTN|nr:LCP family protein [Streptomyces turgidiscabies]MDQ0932044.1 LCP family protein required for cell wall assembly [Streptomyces turgidiscabies]
MGDGERTSVDVGGAESQVGRQVGRRSSRWLKAVGFTLAGTLVLAVMGAGYAYWHLNDNIKSVDIDNALGDNRPAKTRSLPSAGPSASATPLPSEALNILVLGSDSRSGKRNHALGGGSSEGARSDTAMVVHLDAGRTRATIVSIPRDTLVRRPSCPLSDGGSTAEVSRVMFNTAYSVGGPVCAVKTVELMTNVRMDHYLEVDFAGFADLVNALGGVTVTTDEDIHDDDSHLDLAAGEHHLDGTKALALARTRHGIGDGSDLGRIGLQQKLVKALLRQISSTNLLTSPAKLYKVADVATAGLTTDTGLNSLSKLMSLGQSLQGLSADELTTVMMPVVPAASDANRVVAEEPEAANLWATLH